MSFIESTGVACSDSVSHNRVQVLSIPVLLLGCSKDWTCNLCGNNYKDEDNSPQTLNDKNQQTSSQKFWQLISSV